MITVDKVRYGGCYNLVIHGYKENHPTFESRQLFEYESSLYEYLSNFFAQETYTRRCDSYDIHIGVSKIAEPEE